MADYRAKIQRKGQAVLQPGEQVLATSRAAVEGPSVGVVGGLPTVLALTASKRSRVEAQGFPASMNMILAVTDRRVLVFRRLFLRQRYAFRGEVPFAALQSVSVERRGLSPRLRFVLASGAELMFTTYRLDHPDEFVRILNQGCRAWALVAPRVRPPAIPVVPPPPPL
jgi:hypothetical protein